MDRGAWQATGHGVARVSEISYNFPFPWDKVPEDCLSQLHGKKYLRIIPLNFMRKKKKTPEDNHLQFCRAYNSSIKNYTYSPK